MRRFIGAAFVVSCFLTSVSAFAAEQDSALPSEGRQSISKLCKIEFFQGKPYFPNLLDKSSHEKCFLDDLNSEPCSEAVDMRSVEEQHALFTTILAFTAEQVYYTTPSKSMLRHKLALSAASHAHATATEMSLKVELAHSAGSILTHATLRGIFLRKLSRQDADVKLFSDAARAAFDALTVRKSADEGSCAGRNCFADAVKNAAKDWLKAYNAAMKSLVAAKVPEEKELTGRLLKIALLKPNDTVETLKKALLLPYGGLPLLAQQLSSIEVRAVEEWEVVDDAEQSVVNKASVQAALSCQDNVGSMAEQENASDLIEDEQEKALAGAAKQEQAADPADDQGNADSALQQEMVADSAVTSSVAQTFDSSSEPVVKFLSLDKILELRGTYQAVGKAAPQQETMDGPQPDLSESHAQVAQHHEAEEEPHDAGLEDEEPIFSQVWTAAGRFIKSLADES